MSETSFKVNSQLLPSGFPREFDAHIYFNEANREQAAVLREKLKIDFVAKTVFIGDLISKPIGPHPLPMFEVNFPVAHFAEMVLWLMKERGDLNVLVHALSGDDYQDHTKGALWLGSVVDLDFSVF